MKILAIETSCDDTSIALLENDSPIVMETYSQLIEHSKFGGIIPEIASRIHTKSICDLIQKLMNKSGYSLSEINYIVVTQGPGLVNSLQVGILVAKNLSMLLNIPIYAINHIEAHIFSPFITTQYDIPEKFLGVVISGGHTNIYLSGNDFKYKLLSKTTDDAIGEVFDKVGKMLELDYPGGPNVEKKANEFKKIDSKPLFHVPKIKDNNMSFSGIKSQVVNYLKNNEIIISKQKEIIPSICYWTQKILFKHLIDRIFFFVEKYNINVISIGGGVSNNTYLRELISNKLKNQVVLFPKKKYTVDNATMIGYLFYIKYIDNKIKPKKLTFDAKPRWELN